MSEVVDWEHLKWGSFTNQFKAFKREHPTSDIDNLEEFAEMILKHPKHYKPRTLKRAHFYINVINKHHKNEPHLSGGDFKNYLPTPKNILNQTSNVVKNIGTIGKNVLYGRTSAYPPSAQKIIDANKDAIVQNITLQRNPLPSAYTKIMSLVTGGETDRRIAEQPKDTLYHIGMWVRLSNGKTIKVEKNEVINLQVNPSKPAEEETFQVPSPPSNLTFGEMLEKTRLNVGDNRFFSYSAKDNNCGNFIEMILRVNGMNSTATHNFIGQDTKTILKGFPSLRKALNTVTDIAGRANVLIEGGRVGGRRAEDIEWRLDY